MAWYGGGAGTSISTYRVCLDMRTSSQSETQGYIQVRRWVEVTRGNFNGTILNTSWAGQVRIYGSGTYADSGWVNVGWKNYGSTTTQSCNASYTSYSGAWHNSSVSGVYSPSVPTWAPKAPTNVSVTRNSNTKNTVKWTNNSTSARKYASLTVQRSTDGGSWVTIKSGLAASTTSYADSTTSANHYYRYRVAAVNSAGTTYSGATGYVYNTPNACTNVVNTRNSDTKNTVTWKLGTTNSNLYSSILIRRSVDGGSWSDLATLTKSATSYVDSKTSANHSYRYAVIARNSAGSSAAAYSGTTYNTPAAPSKVTVSRKAETTVTVKIENPAKTATALQLQRSTDGSDWVTVKTVNGTVTSVDDTPGGGTFYYRARNTRGSLASAWKNAESAVVTICPPNAPTLEYPASSAIISKADSTVTFRWAHNPIDGSAQQSAQVQYSTNGGTDWTTADVSGASGSLTIDNDFAVNSTVTWRVRTKGADDDYGPYSGNRTFRVYQVPTAVITSPADGEEIENTPVHFEISYSDQSGTLDSATLVISDSGTTVYEAELGKATELTITTDQWLPEDGKTYRFTVTCRSTSTLQCSAVRDSLVAFDLPRLVYLGIEADEETGYVRMMLHESYGDGQEPVAVSIYRIVDDVRTLVADNALNVLTVEDRYAPINTEFWYEAVSFADSGAANSARYRGSVDSKYAFFYFGDDMAKAYLNVEEEVDASNPNEKIEYYAGRKYPVSYDDDCIEETRSFSATIATREEYRAFKRLSVAKGRCVYKSLDGEVIHVKGAVNVSKDHTHPSVFGSVSFDMTRIDGVVL